METSYLNTPVGLLGLEADANGLRSIYFESERTTNKAYRQSHPILKETTQQLSAYFQGRLTCFDLPLAPQGTVFQQRVWKHLQHIPYGSTVTYLQLAKKLGDPNAIRAVGRANGQNPIAIVVPCHRVVGSGNKLVGYAGGIQRKHRLLQHEGALLL